MNHENYKKTFIIDDGSAELVFSTDCNAWVSIDGTLTIDDCDGTPTWPDTGPVNGSFNTSQFEFKRAKMAAVKSMEALINEGNFKYFDGANDDEENFFTLSSMFADSLSNVDSLVNIDVNTLLEEHLIEVEEARDF